VLFAAIFAVIFRDSLSPGLAALAINYSLSITLVLNSFITSINYTETFIVSIERCLELTQTPEEVFNEKYLCF
jgi:ATP-binding cassette subfamily C (CFTR/MRP) protein 1